MSVATMAASDDATAALRHCAAVTRREAGNFYWGIRLLPRPKFEALCAIYAFARRDRRHRRRDARRRDQTRRAGAGASGIEQLEGDTPGPVLTALAHVERSFPLPRQSFVDLIDGVQMDLAGTHYETFDQLVVYCRRVAGSIGRLCLAVFGAPDAKAASLADDLGVAMQLTNILRDVREDALNGRVYLPAEDLRRFAWPAEGGGDSAAIAARSPAAPGPLAELVHFEAARNREWFERGRQLLGLLDRRSAACVLAMSSIYARLLELIDARPERILEGRVRLSTRRKGRDRSSQPPEPTVSPTKSS